MARYDKHHKEATRSRILSAAGKRLKADGIDGSGVATLMADAGLTNGAFYAHFTSKDQLVMEAIANELGSQAAQLADLAPGRAGVDEFVRQYLSPGHRDDTRDGCPSAALLDEITRGSKETRKAYTEGVLRTIDETAARIAPHDPPSARLAVLSAFALMIGSIQLARALTDEQLSDAVLSEAVTNTLAILDSADPTHRPPAKRSPRLSTSLRAR